MEQAAGTFLESLEQLGPLVVVPVLILLGVIWFMRSMWMEDRSELKRVSDARVADGLALANSMKSVTDNLSAHTQAQVLSQQALQSVQNELARLTTEIARGKP